MSDFDIGIDNYEIIEKGYTLIINGKIVLEKIKTMEEIVKEIKKYLRLRFKEEIK